MVEFLTIVKVSPLVAFVAWVVTKEEIFRGFREGCAKLKEGKCGWRKWVCEKLAYLPTCYFCFSCWVSAVVMVIYPIKVEADDWRGYLFAYAEVVLVANIYLVLFNILRAILRWIQAKADGAEAEKRLLSQLSKRTRNRIKPYGF